MNWKRGLLRSWFVLSTLWIVGTTLIMRPDISYEAQAELSATARQAAQEIRAEQDDALIKAKMRRDLTQKSLEHTRQVFREEFPDLASYGDGDMLAQMHKRYYADLHPLDFIERIEGGENAMNLIEDPELRAWWNEALAKPRSGPWTKYQKAQKMKTLREADLSIQQHEQNLWAFFAIGPGASAALLILGSMLFWALAGFRRS